MEFIGSFISKTVKRLLPAFLALCLVFSLPVDTALASNVDSSLVVGIQSTKTLTIRPLLPVERDMLSVYDLVYESLITIDDDYNPRGCLAESWESSANGKTWTFHLRPNVFFSDGTPLKAADVVASAQYILDRANDEATTDSGFYSNLKYFIKSASASDDSTVVIKTSKRACFGLLYAMNFPVVPASQVDSDNPLGTGPYQIGTFTPKDLIWLQTNPHWWKAQPRVKEIMFSLYATQKEIVETYEYARVDAVFTRSIAAAQYKSGTNSLAISFRTNQLECLLMNNAANELTHDVRIAIRNLVDTDKIITNVYSGMATKTDLPLYPGTWMYNDTLSSYFTKNKEEAVRLLEEAGWSDSNEDGILDKLNSEGKLVNLHLRFYTYEEPESDVRVEAANIIADALQSVGISCTVETLTMANMAEKLKAGSYDLALVSYAMDRCPDPGFMLMKGNSGNYTRYKSNPMTELFEELRTEVTQEGYRKKLWQIQAKFAEDCPLICLYWRKGTVLTKFMYTTVRDVREYELLRGIETFAP